jgi:hypothetical protein
MNEINLELLRYSDANECTLGLLFVNGVFFTYILEDKYREKKVRGETRIPEGTYEIGLMKELTPLTKRYRERYPSFFEWHLHVRNVPNYEGIYIHPGNNKDHTDGCLLTAGNINNNRVEPGSTFNSLRDYRRLYDVLFPHLQKGGKVKIWIHSYYQM